MFVREVRESDSENLVGLIKKVEKESEFMLMEPGERQITPEQQQQRIHSIKKRDNSTIFVAENEEQLVGYMFAMGGTAKRNQHSVYVVIGILKDYRGQGIGTTLFEKLEEWAVERKVRRLELTTVTQNVAGVALYKKMGFEVEGTKKDSLLIDGEFVDEYYMAKLV
ncbi:GNAT family N-acetyltransferase [Neobacillus drentensis]|uniref:GNAT family N-acetyltransferase n=1 Tax=Neobacillus drentensis TaxID=220684 RepID=UPI002FFE0603